jgi:hypothetical protein
MPIFSDGIIVDWPHLRKVHQHEEQRVPGECKRSVWCQQSRSVRICGRRRLEGADIALRIAALKKGEEDETVE